MEDYRDLLRDLQWLSIRPRVDEELRDLFDSIVKMYLAWEKSLTSFQRLELRILCLESMQNTSLVYKHSLRFLTVRINFSDPFTRWSYMFVFMMRHVHLVFYALDQAVYEKILKVIPSGRPTNVCMIGGGPGSDVLGLGLFLMKHGCTSKLTDQVNVLDKCQEWSDSWSQLHRFLPERYSKGIPEVNYHSFDYLNNKLTPEQLGCVEDAHIVTMIKSLSPVAAWLKTKPIHQSYVRGAYGQLKCVISEWHSVYEILKAMKPGAFLLYIDNETGPQRQILMNTVKFLKFKIIFDRIFRGVRMPSHFFSSTSRDLMNTLNYKPCTTAGTNEVIILKKEVS